MYEITPLTRDLHATRCFAKDVSFCSDHPEGKAALVSSEIEFIVEGGGSLLLLANGRNDDVSVSHHSSHERTNVPPPQFLRGKTVSPSGRKLRRKI